MGVTLLRAVRARALHDFTVAWRHRLPRQRTQFNLEPDQVHRGQSKETMADFDQWAEGYDRFYLHKTLRKISEQSQ